MMLERTIRKGNFLEKKGIKQKARFWIKKLNHQFSEIGLDVYHHHSIMFKQHKRKLLMFLQ